MHLTVRFLGEVEPGQAAMVVDRLSTPLPMDPFAVTLGRPGAFPSRGAPRVVWLGFSEGLAPFQRLERELSARLRTAGIPREDRPYSPHLTLARVRDARGMRLPALLDSVDVPDASGVVDAITLFESRLSPQGPRYTALHRTPLARV
jgi:2'-5' RNA ligase